MTAVSRLSVRDLAAESLAGLTQRPARSLLTMLGTVLGIGAFVAILGLTATAGGQIDKRFTALAATEITVQDVGTGDSATDGLSFPVDASARVQALNGVQHAGVLWPVPVRDPRISAQTTGAATAGLDLVAASPQALTAMHPTMRFGRSYDDFHLLRAERVALLGRGAAARLGISDLAGNPAVFIDGEPYLVIGVIDAVQRRPEMLLSVIIPTSTALARYGPPVDRRAEMIIETKVGAAQLIASQAALALRPDAPRRFKVIAPPDPQTLRGHVTSDFDVLFILLAAVSLVIGAVGIANTTLVAVLERVNEIGLRRSLGARPIHIAAQFLTESTALGLLGGLVGASLGVAIVVGTAVVQQWTAILAPWTVVGAPLLGSGIGMLAGLYPALRAARIEPVEALRR